MREDFGLVNPGLLNSGLIESGLISDSSGALSLSGLDRVGGANGSFIAHRQLVTAARPPACQHGPPVTGLHTLPEAVRFGALAIIRLKCSFRHFLGYSISSEPAEACGSARHDFFGSNTCLFRHSDARRRKTVTSKYSKRGKGAVSDQKVR